MSNLGSQDAGDVDYSLQQANQIVYIVFFANALKRLQIETQWFVKQILAVSKYSWLIK